MSTKCSVLNHWILDSEATCHMCNQETLINDFQRLQKPLNVVLGDGQSPQATGQRSAILEIKLPNGKNKACTFHNVLLVPSLSLA